MGWLKSAAQWQFIEHGKHPGLMSAVAQIVDEEASSPTSALLWQKEGSVGKACCIEPMLMDEAELSLNRIARSTQGKERVSFYMFVYKTPCRTCVQKMRSFVQNTGDYFLYYKLGFCEVYSHPTFGYADLDDFLRNSNLLKDWRIKVFSGGPVGGARRTNDFVWYQTNWYDIHAGAA